MAEETVITADAIEEPVTEQADNMENAAPSTETTEAKPEKMFTQSELDAIITKRLERDRESSTKKNAQEARDSYIEEQGYTYKDKLITTEWEYKQALKDDAATRQLEDQDLPDDVIKELIENRNFRERYEAKEKDNQIKAERDADFQTFVAAYPDVKEVPQSVWDQVTQGKNLVDAYAKHENISLKQQLFELTKGKEIETNNQNNAVSSTGAVTNKGASVPGHFTYTQVKAMSQTEVNKHYNAINDSMKRAGWYNT